MGNVAAYIRVSTESQRDDGSHIGQRERIAEWAKANEYEPGGWDDYHKNDAEGELKTWDSIDKATTGDISWFEDIAISGQSDQREAYDRLIDSYDEYNVVVFRELSRFGRDPVKVTKDAQAIMESGVEFVSIKEPEWDSTSAAGKFLMRQFANMNAFYADLRREQAIKAAERRKEQGLQVGRPRKLDESPELREEVHHLREKGVSYSAIARIIEDKPSGPDDISRSTIMRECKNAGVEPGGEA